MSDRESGFPDGRALPHQSHAAFSRVGAYLPNTLGGEGSLVRDEEATVPANLCDSDLPFGMRYWKPGFLVVLASRPAFGKTTLALQMALAVARTSRSVVLVAEDPAALALRLLALCSHIHLSTLKHNAFSADERVMVSESGRLLGELPLFLTADSGECVGGINELCTKFQVQALSQEVPDLGLLVLDGAGSQTKSPKDMGRILGELASLEQLKMTAAKYCFAVLITAPIDCAVENRRDRRPILADLRRKPDLAELSDIIYGLYRDEIYDPHSLDRGLAELLVLKDMHGFAESIRLVFEPLIPCFYDLPQVLAACAGEFESSQFVESGSHDCDLNPR